MIRRVVFFVLLGASAAGGVASGQGSPTVTTALSVSEATVGDRLTLEVTVEHDEMSSVSWPQPESIGEFEVLEIAAAEPMSVGGGRQRSVARYVLTSFELGAMDVPAMDLALSSSDGSVAELNTQPVPVTISSVGRDDGGDIRDIKPPLAIARNWLLVLPWIVVLGVLAGVGWWLYRRYAKRARSQTVSGESLAPARPAHEIALEALAQLEGSGMLERGEIKPYYIAASEILRSYLDARYGIDALDMTSHDVMDELRRVSLEGPTLDKFGVFFASSDLVKFAKHRPDVAECRDVVVQARFLIVRTQEKKPEIAEREALDEEDSRSSDDVALSVGRAAAPR